MTNSPVPTVLAMLLCDQVIVDAGTNKKSLIGVFDNLNSVGFPSQTRIAIYAKLTDAEGKYDFRVRIVHLKDETLLGEFEIKGAAFADQLRPAELIIDLPALVFPEAGKYEFQLYANEIYLSRITMEAKSIQG